jgi:hypothetical protein
MSLDIVKAGEIWRHTTGKRLRFLAKVDTWLYGPAWVAEDLATGNPSFVGGEEWNMVNWAKEEKPCCSA